MHKIDKNKRIFNLGSTSYDNEAQQGQDKYPKTLVYCW